MKWIVIIVVSSIMDTYARPSYGSPPSPPPSKYGAAPSSYDPKSSSQIYGSAPPSTYYPGVPSPVKSTTRPGGASKTVSRSETKSPQPTNNPPKQPPKSGYPPVSSIKYMSGTTNQGVKVMEKILTHPSYNTTTVDSLPKNTILVCLALLRPCLFCSTNGPQKVQLEQDLNSEFVTYLNKTIPDVSSKSISICNIVPNGNTTAIQMGILPDVNGEPNVPILKAIRDLVTMVRNKNATADHIGDLLRALDPTTFGATDISSAQKSDETPTKGKESTFTAPIIAGIVVGGCALLALLGFAAFKYAKPKEERGTGPSGQNKLSHLWFQNNDDVLSQQTGATSSRSISRHFSQPRLFEDNRGSVHVGYSSFSVPKGLDIAEISPDSSNVPFYINGDVNPRYSDVFSDHGRLINPYKSAYANSEFMNGSFIDNDGIESQRNTFTSMNK